MSDEYKQKYEVVFQGDLALARKFMPQIREILGAIRFQNIMIRDNEGTELDFGGSDLTILPQHPLQVGVRVRRSFATRYDEFTQDDKERTQMSCDIYFLGYATDNETTLQSYMVWNGKDFERHRDTDVIPVVDRRQNAKHSLVSFNCYRNSDIRENCKVYAIVGHIGGNSATAKQALADDGDW